MEEQGGKVILGQRGLWSGTASSIRLCAALLGSFSLIFKRVITGTFKHFLFGNPFSNPYKRLLFFCKKLGPDGTRLELAFALCLEWIPLMVAYVCDDFFST